MNIVEFQKKYKSKYISRLCNSNTEIKRGYLQANSRKKQSLIIKVTDICNSQFSKGQELDVIHVSNKIYDITRNLMYEASIRGVKLDNLQLGKLGSYHVDVIKPSLMDYFETLLRNQSKYLTRKLLPKYAITRDIYLMNDICNIIKVDMELLLSSKEI